MDPTGRRSPNRTRTRTVPGTTTRSPRRPTSRFSSVSVDRYLPVIAIIAMVATYLQVAPYFALTFIALVWLLATRVTKNHRFLGLSLTEGLAWAATCLIFLFLAALALGATQTPV
jgi:hypothetical protein